MILKKPYAFIIKHFRLIHLMMLACLAYLLMIARDINKLFASLQASSTFIYAGAEAYINKSVYYILFIFLFLSGVVFWLLREKKKPTKLYLFLILYGIVEIFLFYYEFNLLAVLQENVLESDQLILGRDISTICLLPNYILMCICFIRGIGFNLKQFNFSKDVEELEIADVDSAEFEVLIGQNNYKYFRLARRTIREIKYYILENKFAISVFGGILALFFTGYGIYYYNTYLKKTNKEETNVVDGIAYTVRDSFVTTKDFNGNQVNGLYKYIVIELTLYNSTTENKVLNLDNITLANGSLVYYPTITKNQRFYDFGVPYNEGDLLYPSTSKDATLTFEVPKRTNVNNFALRVQYGIDTSGNKVLSKYRKFDVSASNVDKDSSFIKTNVNETINTNVANINPFNLTILGYSILDSYDNRFIVCKEVTACNPLSNVIKPMRSNSETMLVIDYKGTMYEDAKFTKTFNTYNKLFENYCTIKYTVFNKDYSIKANVVANSDVEGKIFITMDRKLVNASKISLVFDFRDNKYEVPLLVNSLT